MTKSTHTLVWDGKAAAAEYAKKTSVFMLRADIQNSRNFYNTNNIYIAGDNLEALKLLRNGYSARIKMIYIDPPHNIDKRCKPFCNCDAESEWLNMMYPRLLIACSLLAENGVIFICANSGELPKLRLILDEIFDIKNFIAQLAWKQRGRRQRPQPVTDTNKHIICYAKNAAKFQTGSVPNSADNEFPYLDETKQQHYKLRILRKWGANCRRADRQNMYYPVKAPDNTDIYPILKKGEEGCWRWEPEKMKSGLENGTVEFVKNNGSWQVYEKVYETEANSRAESDGAGSELEKIFNSKWFDHSKQAELLRLLLNAANTADGDIILDFFAGLSITAHAVLKQNAADGMNRRFILAQVPTNTEHESEAYRAGFRDICELGLKKLNRAADHIGNSNAEYKDDIDKGYKLFRVVRPQKMPL